MAQNHLKSGFPPPAQGRRFPPGWRQGASASPLPDGLLPRVILLSALDAWNWKHNFQTKATLAFTTHVFFLDLDFFNPAVVFSASEALSFQTNCLR